MKLLIADHSQIDRSRIITELTGVPGVTIVGTAGSARDVIDRISLLHPDVVLLDVRLCTTCSLDLLQLLKVSQPELQVIVLTDQPVVHPRHAHPHRLTGADFLLDKVSNLSGILALLREAATER